MKSLKILLITLTLTNLLYADNSNLARECIENNNKKICKTLIDTNALSSLQECVVTCQSIGIDDYCPKSCNSVGLIYMIAGEYNQAMAYFKKSISLGNESSYLYFADLHYKSGNMEALQMLETRCNQNEKDKEIQAIACYALGSIYLKGKGVFNIGKGVAQNYAQALKYMQKSCDLGIEESSGGISCAILGDLYLYGFGTRINTKLAQELYGKSCDLGFQPSCNKYNNFDSLLSTQ